MFQTRLKRYTLKIGKILSDTLSSEFEKVAKFGRNEGPNKRLVGVKNEIGFHSIRARDIVGEHTILFAGPGERIEFKHIAHSRDALTNGAINAIKYLFNVDKDDARIISTQEILGLNE